MRGARRVELTWDEAEGSARYWRFNTDHKVLGMQYLISCGTPLFIAGLAAMLMRVELATPGLDEPLVVEAGLLFWAFVTSTWLGLFIVYYLL
jgi:heme/copper-type cytochrome/quinol oxidase subunit 1